MAFHIPVATGDHKTLNKAFWCKNVNRSNAISLKLRATSSSHAQKKRHFSWPTQKDSKFENLKTRAISEKEFGEAPLITEDEFDALVLRSTVPVLVDFWAPWCGPCRMIGPLIDELQKEYGDKLKCYKLNTDETPSIATKYGIRSIPTNIIFKNGEKMDSIIGAVSLNTFKQVINRYID